MSVLTDNPVSSWPFLQEPLWRWFLFFGALIGISIAWRGVIDFVK